MKNSDGDFVDAYHKVSVIWRVNDSWAFGSYVLFILEKGFSQFQANLLNTVFMLVGATLDPTTGKLADKYGQKRIFIWGQVAWGFGLVVYAIGGRLTHFFAAEVLAAVGAALISEALESWLRNNVGEKAYHSAITRTARVTTMLVIPFAFLGGAIGDVADRRWLWVLSALTASIAALISHRILRKLPEGRPLTTVSIKETARYSWQDSSLKYTLVVSFVYTACVMPFNMFWAPILAETSGSKWWLGGMWIVIAPALALGQYLADTRFLKINGEGVAISIFLTGIPLLLINVYPKAFFIALMFGLHEIGRGAINPLISTYSNRYIDNEIRSTANSIRSAVSTLGAALGLVVSGALTLVLPALFIWTLAALVLIFLGVYSWKNGD